MVGGNRKVVTAQVATWSSYKNKENEFVTTTEWHRVVVWGEWAENVCKMAKGSLVLVEGTIKHRDYEDVDKKKIFITEIHGIIKQMPIKKAQSDQKEINESSTGSNTADDLPF